VFYISFEEKIYIYIDTCFKVKCLYAFGTYFDKCFYFKMYNIHVLHMFSSKKSKLMWHKIKNKKTLVLHLSNIFKLTYLKSFENAQKK
jgi:hypothetical protein